MPQPALRILLVCKLADFTLAENILQPLLASGRVGHIHVLRDRPLEGCDSRVSFLTPPRPRRGSLRHLARTRQGIRAVRQEGIDLVIGVLNTPHGWIGRYIAARTGRPYVHVAIAGAREFWVDGKLVERFNLWAFASAAAITVTGSLTRQYLIRKGLKPERVHLMPNLPNAAFAQVPWHDGRRWDVVSLSRIDANKNVEMLIRALALLPAAHRPRVAIGGDGSHLPQVKQLAHEMGVEQSIDFLGFVDGVEAKVRLLTQSKVFVSCSRGEGFPVSLLEAMACGCVPVVTAVGDIADVVQTGVNGFLLTTPDSTDELAVYLTRLLHDDALRLRLARAAYAAKEHYSVQRNGERWADVLDGISPHP